MLDVFRSTCRNMFSYPNRLSSALLFFVIEMDDCGNDNNGHGSLPRVQ